MIPTLRKLTDSKKGIKNFVTALSLELTNNYEESPSTTPTEILLTEREEVKAFFNLNTYGSAEHIIMVISKINQNLDLTMTYQQLIQTNINSDIPNSTEIAIHYLKEEVRQILRGLTQKQPTTIDHTIDEVIDLSSIILQLQKR
jgi:hypothetical protein